MRRDGGLLRQWGQVLPLLTVVVALAALVVMGPTGWGPPWWRGPSPTISEVQADDILEMRLEQLTRLARVELEQQLEEVRP